jgi:putative dehydrogenase
MSRNVGVIGLGAMGLGVARSLLRAGFRVHACDLRSAVLESFAADGGVACANPSELGAQCEVVITLVVNAAQTEAVLFGTQGAVASMKPGSVVIASATVSPDFAIDLGKRVEAAGLQMLDAPVSGGAARAASGEMTMMTSGPAAAYAASEDVLAGMAGKVYRLGSEHGVGSKVKIINQLLAGVHIAAAAEAMALGLREGVDAESLYDVITIAPAIRGCSKTACRTSSRAITRRSPQSIFSSRISVSCWIPHAARNFRCRSRLRHIRCS